ncbi:MAG: hypothetical protein OXI81_03830 [Paracoccaceae bacterium]|nr:hypothetical protein [Paracoccaceae bacterium]
MADDKDRAVWTPQDLRTVAAAMHGSPSGALTALGNRIGVDARQMRRWATGTPIPEGVVRDIEAILDIHAPPETGWRRDEWIVGEGASEEHRRRREYIVHTWPPRFRCRAVEVDPETGVPMPAETPADVVTGLTFSASEDTVLAEFDWIDRPPTGQALVTLLEATADALHENGID